MTDTTDIAALRELLRHESLESDHHVGVTVTTLRLLLSKADTLEAERQRAERGEAAAGIIQQMYNERKTEESAADLYNRLLRTEETLIASTDLLSAAEAEIAALKAKLANPVVFPERKKASFYSYYQFSNKDLASVYNGAIREIKHKLNAAGFTVKG